MAFFSLQPFPDGDQMTHQGSLEDPGLEQGLDCVMMMMV